MKTVYLANTPKQQERIVDQDTQCEIIVNPPKKRVAYNGIMGKLMLFSAMMGGCDFMDSNYTSKKVKAKKDELYFIPLNKKEQKLDYETKQDLKRLKLHLKVMNALTDYEQILKYKLR